MKLNKTQLKTLKRIADAGYIYEGQINGLIILSLRGKGLIELTDDPCSQNWKLTHAGHGVIATDAAPPTTPPQ